jgi:aspartate-semialdehyde dehydrogenase
MMPSEFFFRDKIPVAILGATGCVGQKFIQLLTKHPWFQIVAVCASERSVGKPYGEVVNWLMPDPLDYEIAQLPILSCHAPLTCSLLFSGLDSSAAGTIESQWVEKGFTVVSNAKNHRMDPTVPLVIGEVNADHLALMDQQSFKPGQLVTNPNCSVIGLTMALKPLFDQFGLEAVQVVTLQALSGAGYPGVASLDIQDNVIPYIEGEEEKIETEPLKILGKLHNGKIQEAVFKISAQCNRVAVTDGHLACVSVKLKSQPTEQEIIRAWREFKAEPQEWVLPSAPLHPLYYFEQPHFPQPKRHRELDRAMAVSIGHLRRCPVLDFKFNLLSHNTVRGAVGSALLNAELLVKKGKIYW